MDLLLDTMSLLYRAHAVAPPALDGLASHVARWADEFSATRVAFALDVPAPTIRHRLWPDYKRTRRRTPKNLRAQLSDLETTLASLGDVYRAPGFEADDILATLARRVRERARPGLVITRDRDLLALAHGTIDVLLLDSSARPGIRYDARAVERRTGVTPQQIGDWRALKGDRGDGVPGVPNLHPRDAARLIREFGDVEDVLAHLHTVRPRRLRHTLATHVELVRRNAELLRLREDVPL